MLWYFSVPGVHSLGRAIRVVINGLHQFLCIQIIPLGDSVFVPSCSEEQRKQSICFRLICHLKCKMLLLGKMGSLYIILHFCHLLLLQNVEVPVRDTGIDAIAVSAVKSVLYCLASSSSQFKNLTPDKDKLNFLVHYFTLSVVSVLPMLVS